MPRDVPGGGAPAPGGAAPSRARVVRAALASGAASLALLALLLWYVDWGVLARLLAALRPSVLVLALAVLLVVQVIGALRVALLVRVPGGWRGPRAVALMDVTVAHQFLLRILPARLGDVVFLWLIRRQFRASLGVNLAMYLSIKLWDLRVLLGVFLGAGLFIAARGEHQMWLLAGPALGVALLLWLPTRVLLLAPVAGGRVLERIVRHTRLAGPVVRGQALLDTIRAAAGTTPPFRSATLAVVSWAASFTVFVILLRAYAVALDPLHVAFIYGAMVLLQVLPIGTTGSFGLGEVGLAGLLVAFGSPATVAASVTVALAGTHLALSAALLVLWGAGRLLTGGGVALRGLASRDSGPGRSPRQSNRP